MPPPQEQARQLYLIHGNSDAEVNNARYELVCSLLTPEERDAGLTEVRSAGNQPLSLDRAMSEIIGELGTGSFIPGAKRVVVVYDLKEFYDASKKKGAAKAKPAKEAKPTKGRDRVEVFAEWLDQTLPTTENVAIFVCTESDEKGRIVAQDGELYRLVRERGVVIERKEKPLNFDFEDQVLSGNAVGAVTVLHEWIDRAGNDSGSRLKIYTTLAGLVELVLQASCLENAREAQVPAAQATVSDGFPALARIPSWKGKKVEALAKRFTRTSLRDMVAALDHMQATLYPTGEEDHVGDWTELAEMLVLRLTAIRR
ncbi:hypothetical protein GC173_15870 [bacterium]|nr:hypothetical protein [bacterium]